MPTDDPNEEAVKRSNAESVLRTCRGNRTEAASMLGISRSTLIRRLRRWKIEDDRLAAAQPPFIPLNGNSSALQNAARQIVARMLN